MIHEALGSRLMRWCHVDDGLIGDLLELCAARSRGWFWRQIVGAIGYAAWNRWSHRVIGVRGTVIGILTAWRFDRLWLMSLIAVIACCTLAGGARHRWHVDPLEIAGNLSTIGWWAVCMLDRWSADRRRAAMLDD